MNNFNYQLNELEGKILQILQEFNVPVGIYYLLLSKMTQDIKQIYDQQVALEDQEIKNQPTYLENKDMEDSSADTVIETE